MDIHDYDPDFNELVTREGKRFLSYNCFTCNKKHLIVSSSKENGRIRSAWKMIDKSNNDDVLILHCAKGKTPDYDGNGIIIVINPTNQITKQDRDKIRKRIQRILERNPYVRYMEEEIKNAEQVLLERIEKMKSYKERIDDSLIDLKSGLNEIRKVE